MCVCVCVGGGGGGQQKLFYENRLYCTVLRPSQIHWNWPEECVFKNRCETICCIEGQRNSLMPLNCTAEYLHPFAMPLNGLAVISSRTYARVSLEADPLYPLALSNGPFLSETVAKADWRWKDYFERGGGGGCTHTQTHTDTQTHRHTHTHTDRQTHTHTHTHARARARAPTHTHASTHARTHRWASPWLIQLCKLHCFILFHQAFTAAWLFYNELRVSLLLGVFRLFTNSYSVRTQVLFFFRGAIRMNLLPESSETTPSKCTYQSQYISSDCASLGDYMGMYNTVV